LGGGIFTVNGDEWAYQRKTMAPEFFMDKVKVMTHNLLTINMGSKSGLVSWMFVWCIYMQGMIQLIEDSTAPLLELWESILDSAGGSKEIVVDDYVRNISADVISRACFGSSFAKGEEIFCRLRKLQTAISQQDAFVGLSALW
jgi:cytochrome P450